MSYLIHRDIGRKTMSNDKAYRAAACAMVTHGTGSGTRVLLTRRHPGLKFLGGFDAFPGGRVEKSDGNVDDPKQRDRVLALAAARELDEEVGISIDPNAMMPFGIWTTPPFSQHRFRAQYFAARVDEARQSLECNSEISAYRWCHPDDALTLHEDGHLSLTYPVLETLRMFSAHGCDLDAAAQVLQARGEDAYPIAGGEMKAGLHLCPLRTPTLPPHTHTNCYVFGGKEFVVVDPASPDDDEQARLLQYIETLEEAGGTLKAIWLSHHHHDHVGGVEALRDARGVPVCAHPQTAERVPFPVDRTLNEGDVWELAMHAGAPQKWVMIHTSGHAPGHLCFFEERSRSLYSGDNVLGEGTVLIAAPDGHMRTYLQTLERMRNLGAHMLFPSHGPPVATVETLIDTYVRHRLHRERAVLDALAEPRTLPELLLLVYHDVPTSAHGIATLSLAAHLEKLGEERRVTSDNDRYRIA